MEKYENLGVVGEGSYGMVIKCKHKETGQHVAIKKFLESEDDKMVKKIAMREVRMLKQLRHENLVNLIEVFRRKKRLYLVFEFVDHTVLDDLERCPNGLDEDSIRKVLWQVLKGIEFCHLHNIIHRDIKPENILVSKSGVVKLCDFGFARTLAQPGENCTDYVATRWYRAPELLVGDTKYGRAVDIWAVGCLTAEMLTGEPLFPGDSDIDQLFHIVKTFGNLTPRHREIFHKNPLFVGMRLPEVREVEQIDRKFPRISPLSLDLMKQCLRLEANDRPTCSQLLRHELFTKDGFAQRFQAEIKTKCQKECNDNPLLKSLNSRSSTNDKNSRDNIENQENKKDKKKKEKEKRESKDSGEEKPKRKLPDPDKFSKKSQVSVTTDATLPPASTRSQSKQSQMSSTDPPQQADDTTGGGGSPPNPAESMPPIATREQPTMAWVNDKVKKSPATGGGTGGYMKKPATTHHSQVLTPQTPSLQLEKTFLHEKTLQYDKMINAKIKRSQADNAGSVGGGGSRGSVVLPEVRGAEATGKGGQHKGKKSQLPHITNLDPFSDINQGSPNAGTPGDKDQSNLPLVL